MGKVPEGDHHFLYGDGHGYTLSGGADSHSLGHGVDSHPHSHSRGLLGHHSHHGLRDRHSHHGLRDRHSHHGLLGRLSQHGLLGHLFNHGLGHQPLQDPYNGTSVAGVLPVVELKVQMRSERSRKVITKKLAKLEGVVSVDVDLHQQKVTVRGNVSPAEVLKKVRKTGREAQFWMDEAVYTSYPAVGYPAVGYPAGSYSVV